MRICGCDDFGHGRFLGKGIGHETVNWTILGDIGREGSDPKALRSSASLCSITLVGFSPASLDIWTTLPKAPSRLINHLLIKPSETTCF